MDSNNVGQQKTETRRIMKKFLTALLCLLPSISLAQSDYFVVWSIGSGLTGDLVKLDADLNQGTKYFTFNGGLYNAENSVAPAVGTCSLLQSGNITCRFNALSRSYALDLNKDLGGVIVERDQLGEVSGTALVTFVTAL